MESFFNDLKHSLRILRQNPALTVTAVAAIALGIGANTAMFTVINTVLLDRLPYPDSDRIVDIARRGGGAISEPTFGYLEKNNPGFEDLSAYHAGSSMTLNGGDKPELVETITASRSYFQLFGASPILGRAFTAEEDNPGGIRALILSYSLWQRRFGGDATILSKTLTLGGAPYAIVGVLSPSFRPYSAADVWIPLQADPNSMNYASVLTVCGRATLSAAERYAHSRCDVRWIINNAAREQRLKAYESNRKFNDKGRCIEEEFSIRSIVPWSLVALVTLFAGHALVSIPPNFWDTFKRCGVAPQIQTDPTPRRGPAAEFPIRFAR